MSEPINSKPLCKPIVKKTYTKGVKIRKEEKAVPSAQKWLSMPMRKP